jgi:DNA-directed RNA polymerase subunit beta'
MLLTEREERRMPTTAFNPRQGFEDILRELNIACKELLTVETGHRKLIVRSVSLGKTNTTAMSFSQQRTIKESGGTFSVPLYAELELQDKNGKKINKAKVMVAKVPLVTQRLTYILGGREYQVTSQFRRMSGVYTRVSDRGEVQGVIVGSMGNRSGQIKMSLDPTTYNITIKPVKSSDRTISVYDLLRAADKTDQEIASKWGKDMVAANKALKKSDAARDNQVMNIAKAMIQNPYDKTVEAPPITSAKVAATYIFKQLKIWTMDPRVTSDTLGSAHSNLTPDALLTTGQKMLNVSKGSEKPSTYNNIGHKRLLSPGNLLRDYLNRNNTEIQQQIKNRLGKDAHDVKSICRNILTKRITMFFRQGGETQLVSEADMTNPLATLVGHRMTTVTGAGGISMGPGMQLGDAQQAHSSHIGFLDPVDTGEKSTTGLQLYMSMGANKVDDRLHTRLYSFKEKKVILVDPLTADKAVVAFPDDIKYVGGKPVARKPLVRASMPGGETKKVKLAECDFAMTNAQSNFGLNANLIPFLDCNNGNRVMIGSKMANQAVSLVNREEPLVQVEDSSTGDTFENNVGKSSARISVADGTVLSVSKDQIVVQGLDKKKHVHELYNEYPTNDPKSMLNHEPVVTKGQLVKKGQILADSNYTRNGTLALGTNLTVGYLPMRGYNYEDGVVISRSASEKLKSQHLYTFKRDSAVKLGTRLNAKLVDGLEDKSVVISKEFFKVWAPRSAATYKNFNELDDDGVVKKGTELHKGYIIIAACMRTDHDPAKASLMKSTRIKSSWRGSEISWEKDSPATVTRVVKRGKDVAVYVRSDEPMKVGDKLVGRYGNKGIVTKVLEDHEMPYAGEDGDGNRKHIEVAMHPAGVPGRINIGQLMEMGASKIAEKTGKVYKVKNFDSDSKDKMRELLAEMKAHKVSDQELVLDPKTDKPIGSVIMGKQYIQKLTHQVDKKMASRPGGMLPGHSGFSYDINNQPRSGAPAGGQAMGALGIYALLGHNARNMLRDLQTHHSTYEQPEKYGDYDSDDYWNALMEGMPPPNAQETFASRKFFAHLKAMGVDPVKNKDEIQLVPMTDKDVLKQCPHAVKRPNYMIKGKDATVEKGGLFDFPEGQIGSTRWGHIKLSKRIINPVFEKPVAIMLGIPVSKATATFKSVGMDALCKQLKSINVDAEIASTRSKLEGAKKTERDLCYRKIKLLKALKKMNLSPHDAYTMQYMPVLPPKMRPISLSGDVGAMGDIDTADINQLYKNVGIANELMGSISKDATTEDKNETAYALYSSVRDTYVTGALDNKGAPMNSLLQAAVQPKEGGGANKHKQAKEGFFQKKLIKRRAELSGRSVITPEPELKLDQVGIPRKMAMNIYRPFIVRQLRTQGYNTLKAAKLILEDPTSPAVRDALERAISDRPLLLKRDPSLHKHNVMAFYPKITEGKSVQIHPLVCGGFNADFDGDTMGAWVPSSDEALEEVKSMVPSKNLFGPKGFQLMNTPEWGAAYGIWQLTEWGKNTKVKVSTPAEAYALHKKGGLDIADIISYKGRKTTVGRMMLFDKLPTEYKKKDVGTQVMYGDELNKSKMTTLLSKIAKERPDLYPAMVDDWKDLGNKYAHEKAWSFGLKDFVAHGDIRDKHLADADKKLDKMKNATAADKVRLYGIAASKIRKEVEDRLKKDGTNRAYRMTRQSGAMNSKYNQVEQLIISPLQVTTSDGDVVPNPVRKAYSEGLGLSDYWDSIPGVRTGTLSRVKGTSDPGAKAKDLVNLNISTVVSTEDCGTKNGVSVSTDDIDVEARYLLKEVKAGTKTYKRNTLVDGEIMSQIRKHHKTIEVRSAMGCKAAKGVCTKCAGFNERGQDYKLGENVGVISAQSLSEPLTQMAMNAFHTGGSASGAGASVGDHFTHLARLMSVPKVVRGSAKISPKDTIVKQIDEDKTVGGFKITLEGVDKPLYVAHDKEIFVKKGDVVKAGQALTSGPINPQELLETSGMPAVREHIVSEMHKVYKGYGVRRRHVEMLVKNLTASVEVIEDPEGDYAPGDRITEKTLNTQNEQRKEQQLPKIQAKPVLLSINQAVRVGTEGDFLAQMNYQHVRSSLVEGMAHGAKSSLHGHNPVPGMAVGYTLGKTGKEGQY